MWFREYLTKYPFSSEDTNMFRFVPSRLSYLSPSKNTDIILDIIFSYHKIWIQWHVLWTRYRALNRQLNMDINNPTLKHFHCWFTSESLNIDDEKWEWGWKTNILQGCYEKKKCLLLSIFHVFSASSKLKWRVSLHFKLIQIAKGHCSPNKPGEDNIDLNWTRKSGPCLY